ncbi:cellulase (glycosyl hydrolase family 5) [Neorhizobium sp. R1-B]|uniref:glycoside hydrolase family 5 protein n=1 Tax=unclassified Neorhizobium TaxID=2629175 RepID=UPI0010CF6CC8|nr:MULTISPECIES: glycoside hydrolase family 5 protein [unclassified Neorhizobium]TCV70510.1 cellulase (glycosyl hydrolase family 5) [Neorhizobium sp. S3-V5DH]TDX81984.1 cellulase (glycosyl hydrolase family 5) [Neorhizobium sp. R1-B]
MEQPLRQNRPSRLHVLGVLVCFTIAAGSAKAEPLCLRGVNLAGAEFGELGAEYGAGYVYPSKETIDYFAGKGFNTVRLPFLWERLQPELHEPFDAAEFKRLYDTVMLIRASGMAVILDPHNYARFRGNLIGSEAVPQSAFADFWRRLAAAFVGVEGVAFGLMNEPYGVSAEDWLLSVNAAIAAIRKTGAGNLLLVPGTAWTGAHSWTTGDYGTPNASAMLGVEDPQDHYAYELHQYLDVDFSGKNSECTRAADAVKAVQDVAGWLRDHGRRGFLGEFAAPASPECLTGLADMVRTVEQNADVWLGWSYWAGGDWWPEDEALNIQPTKEGDRPQMQVLSSFFSEQTGCNR